MNSEVLNLELIIRKPPESVRAWTNYSDDYHANDPAEQPYRIVTTRRLPNGRELRTYWRMPDGSTFDFQEILALKPDGAWTFEIPNGMGFQIIPNRIRSNWHQTHHPQYSGLYRCQPYFCTEGTYDSKLENCS